MKYLIVPIPGREAIQRNFVDLPKRADKYGRDKRITLNERFSIIARGYRLELVDEEFDESGSSFEITEETSPISAVLVSPAKMVCSIASSPNSSPSAKDRDVCMKSDETALRFPSIEEFVADMRKLRFAHGDNKTIYNNSNENVKSAESKQEEKHGANEKKQPFAVRTNTQ